MTCRLAFLRASDPKEQGRSINIFYGLASEVKYHHFWHFLLFTQTNPDTTCERTAQGMNTRRQGRFGAIFEDGYQSTQVCNSSTMTLDYQWSNAKWRLWLSKLLLQGQYLRITGPLLQRHGFCSEIKLKWNPMILHYDGKQTYLKCKWQILRRLCKSEIWTSISLNMNSSKYVFSQELFRINLQLSKFYLQIFSCDYGKNHNNPM